MRISDWSSDVCSSDLPSPPPPPTRTRLLIARPYSNCPPRSRPRPLPPNALFRSKPSSRSIHVHADVVAAARHAVSAEFGTAGAAIRPLPEVYPGFAAGQSATPLFSRILGAAPPLLQGRSEGRRVGEEGVGTGGRR